MENQYDYFSMIIRRRYKWVDRYMSQHKLQDKLYSGLSLKIPQLCKSFIFNVQILNASSVQTGSCMQNIKQGSAVMTEGFQDMQGRIVNDVWSFILIKIAGNIYAFPCW